jgi:hypothetical protein
MGVNVHVELGDIAGKVNRANKFAQIALDVQVLKDSNRFIPFDTGNLRDSSINATKPGSGKIMWDTEYAAKLFYHPEYNFSKDSNPMARGRWFDAAKAEHGSEWPDVAKKAVNKYIDEHRT